MLGFKAICSGLEGLCGLKDCILLVEENIFKKFVLDLILLVCHILLFLLNFIYCTIQI